MNWDAIGATGEWAGAIAVVATLAYLAFQIRQNTNSVRSQSRQTLIDGWSKGQAELGNDPELLRIYADAMTRWTDLSAVEKTRFDVSMGQFLGNLQNGILLWNTGMLDQRTLDQTAYFMLSVILSEGGAKWWKETNFAWPETRSYLDNLLANARDLPPPAEELVPNWMAMARDPR
jgi:hypothetical protein